MSISVPAPASPLRGTRMLSLDFSRKVQATCSVDEDGLSARLEITGLKAAQIIELGHKLELGHYHITFRHELGDRVVGLISRPRGLVRCQVILSGKMLRVLVGIVDRREHLKDIRRSLRARLPIAFDTAAEKQIKVVRKAILAGKYSRALKTITRLRRRARLRDYVALRTADVHLLAGRVPTAYVKYRNLQELVGTRSMRLMAKVRAAELAYVVDHVAPTRLLTKSLQRPLPPLGRLARLRLVQVLIQLGQLEDALALTRVESQQSKDARLALNNRLVLALIRRYLNQGKPYEAALAYMRTHKRLPDSATHTEVLLMAGQAYLELDLPRDAVKALQQSLASTTQIPMRERVLPQLARAYHRGRQYYRARQTTDFYIASYHKGPRLTQMIELRARLKLREGDLDGARKDLSKLAPDQAAPLRKLLDLKSGKPDSDLSEALSRVTKPGEAAVPRTEVKR